MQLSSQRVEGVVTGTINSAHDDAVDLITATGRRLVEAVDDRTAHLTHASEQAMSRLPTFGRTGSRRRTWMRGSRLVMLVLAATAIIVIVIVRILTTRRSAKTPLAPTPGPAADGRRISPSNHRTDETAAPVRGAHVVFEVIAREGNDGWDVCGADGNPVGEPVRTQVDGIERATQLAADAGGGEVIVHGLDGNPRETRMVSAPSD